MLSHFKAFFVSGITVGLVGSFSSSAAFALPQPDEYGDYNVRSYNGGIERVLHFWWQVVDPDPAGLNCRMDTRYDSHSMERPGDIYAYPIMGTLESGSIFESAIFNMGGISQDDRGLPWLYVISSEVGNAQECFVRANSAYVRPIPEP